MLNLFGFATFSGLLTTALLSKWSLAKQSGNPPQPQANESLRQPSSTADVRDDSSNRSVTPDPEDPHTKEPKDHGFNRAGRTEGGR